MTKRVKVLTDAEFEAGGGHGFAAEVAAGVARKCDETLNRGGRGVVLSVTEMLWLAESHRRLHGLNIHNSLDEKNNKRE